jgi:hypothetical protein
MSIIFKIVLGIIGVVFVTRVLPLCYAMFGFEVTIFFGFLVANAVLFTYFREKLKFLD